MEKPLFPGMDEQVQGEHGPGDEQVEQAVGDGRLAHGGDLQGLGHEKGGKKGVLRTMEAPGEEKDQDRPTG